MRGTEYVVTEIVLWLIAAALIGIVMGWLLRGWRREKKLRRRIEASVQEVSGPNAAELATKLAEAEAKLSELAAENERLSGLAGDADSDEAPGSGEAESAGGGVASEASSGSDDAQPDAPDKTVGGDDDQDDGAENVEEDGKGDDGAGEEPVSLT